MDDERDAVEEKGHVLRGYPLAFVVGEVVVDIEREKVRRHEILDAPAVVLILGADIIVRECNLCRFDVFDQHFMRIAAVGWAIQDVRCIYDRFHVRASC